MIDDSRAPPNQGSLCLVDSLFESEDSELEDGIYVFCGGACFHDSWQHLSSATKHQFLMKSEEASSIGNSEKVHVH
jgi:hypothetical protein